MALAELAKCAVCYSGGLDSTVMLFQAVNKFGPENVMAVYTNFGQRNGKDERESFEYFTQKLKIKQTVSLDLSEIFSNVSTEEVTGDKSTPNGTRKMYNRNMTIISCVTAKAMSLGYNTLWLGAHYSDASGGFVDCTQEFYDAVRRCVKVAYPWFDIEMPLISKTKKEVIEWGIGADMGKEDFARTWSCYRPWGGEYYELNNVKYKKPCCVCETCVDRYEHGLKYIWPDLH